MGKSSSRKLRRVIYYTLYRMDPQNTYYKKSFCAKIQKQRKLGNKNPDQSPPHSIRRAPICPLEGPYLPLRGEFLRWEDQSQPPKGGPHASSWPQEDQSWAGDG